MCFVLGEHLKVLPIQEEAGTGIEMKLYRDVS